VYQIGINKGIKLGYFDHLWESAIWPTS